MPKFSKLDITLLGRATSLGYEVELVSPKNHVIQRDGVVWTDFPEMPKSSVIEVFLLAYVDKLVDTGEHFVLEYHCGEDNCFGSHVMTDKDFKKAKSKSD